MEQEGSRKELIEEPELPLRDEKGRFLRSGNPIGKPHGAISKFARLREDFFTAYQQMGGVRGLLTWAKEHQTEFYTMIFKLLPKEIPFSEQRAIDLTYEERLKLLVHGSIREEESGTAFDDINDFELNDEEEEQDDGGL